MGLDDLCGQRGRVFSSWPPAHAVRNDHDVFGVIENERVLVLGSPEPGIGNTGGLPSKCQKGSMHQGVGEPNLGSGDTAAQKWGYLVPRPSYGAGNSERTRG